MVKQIQTEQMETEKCEISSPSFSERSPLIGSPEWEVVELQANNVMVSGMTQNCCWNKEKNRID